jgi:hypothetical protein
MLEYRFTVESVEGGRSLFVLAAGNFPIVILPHENEDIMTALPVLNTRTDTKKAVVVQLLSETNTVHGYYDTAHGYYNPEAFTTSSLKPSITNPSCPVALVRKKNSVLLLVLIKVLDGTSSHPIYGSGCYRRSQPRL